VRRAPAPAKINLALVVGPRRDDGRHDVTTVLQKIDLGDRIAVRRSTRLNVGGYAGDTLVRTAVQALAEAADVKPTVTLESDTGRRNDGNSDRAHEAPSKMTEHIIPCRSGQSPFV